MKPLVLGPKDPRGALHAVLSDEMKAHSILFGSANLQEIRVTVNSCQDSCPITEPRVRLALPCLSMATWQHKQLWPTTLSRLLDAVNLRQ